MQLAGKVALVTGGAVRVGRALALALAAAGCDLFIHYGRSAAPARQTQAEAEALGVQAHIHAADLADPETVAGIMAAAVDRFGQVDILVNSAAIFPETDSFATTGPALWDQILAVNLRAPFLLSQAFAAQLSPAREATVWGKIININDARINRPAPDHFVYRLAKSGLWQMTAMLALELAPHVTVNAVALGAILPPPGRTESYLADIARRFIPLQRPGSSDIVAGNVLHLLQHDFLTGVTLPIDGGQFL